MSCKVGTSNGIDAQAQSIALCLYVAGTTDQMLGRAEGKMLGRAKEEMLDGPRAEMLGRGQTDLQGRAN